MPEPVITALINAGILGPILIAVGWYTLRLQSQLRDSQEKRVDDAQKVVAKLLDLNDRWNASFNQATSSQEELRELLLRLHETLKELRVHGPYRTQSPPGGS